VCPPQRSESGTCAHGGYGRFLARVCVCARVRVCACAHVLVCSFPCFITNAVDVRQVREAGLSEALSGPLRGDQLELPGKAPTRARSPLSCTRKDAQHAVPLLLELCQLLVAALDMLAVVRAARVAAGLAALWRENTGPGTRASAASGGSNETTVDNRGGWPVSRARDLVDAATSLLARAVDESPPVPAAEFASVRQRWTPQSLRQATVPAGTASTRGSATRRTTRLVVGVLLDLAMYAVRVRASLWRAAVTELSDEDLDMLSLAGTTVGTCSWVHWTHWRRSCARAGMPLRSCRHARTHRACSQACDVRSVAVPCLTTAARWRLHRVLCARSARDCTLSKAVSEQLRCGPR
jgi:hypothetical protein